MKYKFWGISACVAVLFLCMGIPALARDKSENRYHQHLEALPKEPCSHDDEVFCTHLPLVLIDTDGVEIPGRYLRNIGENQMKYTTAEDGSTEISGHLIQGVWVNDYVNNSYRDAYQEDIYQQFVDDCKVMIDVIHGQRKISLGRAASMGSGTFQYDVSPWVIGYILGID